MSGSFTALVIFWFVVTVFKYNLTLLWLATLLEERKMRKFEKQKKLEQYDNFVLQMKQDLENEERLKEEKEEMKKEQEAD